MTDSIAYRVARAAWDESPDEIDSHSLTHNPRQRLIVEEWGKRLIEVLAAQGIYINQARNDPSGRW